MCAIVDANIAHQIFGKDQTEAGAAFLVWLATRSGRLVVGGKVRHELEKTPAKGWLPELDRSGRLHELDDKEVNQETESVRPLCRSDDPHVIALAQLSGARLLYSNDTTLHEDFRDSKLVDDPRGSIFSTNRSNRLSRRHRSLLHRKDLCRTAG